MRPRRVRQMPSDRGSGSFLPPYVYVYCVEQCEVVQEAGRFEKPAAVFEGRESSHGRRRIHRDEIADQSAQAVSKSRENIQKVKQSAVLKVETRIICATTDDRDYEHRPDHHGKDDPSTPLTLHHVSDTRKKPGNETNYKRIFHYLLRIPS